MPNQITTQTLHLTAIPKLFKAGDIVLCPSLDNQPHQLKQHKDKINFKNKVYFVDRQGEQHIFRPNGKEYKSDLPAIFHDTPKNRQAITTLYGIEYDTPAIDNPYKPTLTVYGGMVWFYSIMPADSSQAISILEPMTYQTAKAILNTLEQESQASQYRIFKNGMDIDVFLNMPYARRYSLQVMEASHE